MSRHMVRDIMSRDLAFQTRSSFIWQWDTLFHSFLTINGMQVFISAWSSHERKFSLFKADHANEILRRRYRGFIVVVVVDVVVVVVVVVDVVVVVYALVFGWYRSIHSHRESDKAIDFLDGSRIHGNAKMNGLGGNTKQSIATRTKHRHHRHRRHPFRRHRQLRLGVIADFEQR